MGKKSRAKFEFESVTGEKGPIKVTVRASSYLNDDVRDKMIPMLDAAQYMVSRIIYRLRQGINAEGGSNPTKDNGKPRTYYRTGYMFRNFKPKASSPVRVAYSFTGAHKEPMKTGFNKRQVGHTPKGRAKYLGNADLARILNSDNRVKVDIHQPSAGELAEMNRLVQATMTGALLTELGKDAADFAAEKKVRTALAKAKKAANKGTPKGI